MDSKQAIETSINSNDMEWIDKYNKYQMDKIMSKYHSNIKQSPKQKVFDYQSGHKQELILHGFIHGIQSIYIPSAIIALIHLFYWQEPKQYMQFSHTDLTHFNVFGDRTIIEGKRFHEFSGGTYTIYSRSSMDPHRNGVRYFSINTFNTPYDSFGYIGCQRSKDLNPKRHSYRFKPKKPVESEWIARHYGHWWPNQILTVKLDDLSGIIGFFINGKFAARMYIKKSCVYYFVVNVEASTRCCIQIVDTPKTLLKH